jgi:hypothetical protein
MLGARPGRATFISGKCPATMLVPGTGSSGQSESIFGDGWSRHQALTAPRRRVAGTVDDAERQRDSPSEGSWSGGGTVSFGPALSNVPR